MWLIARILLTGLALLAFLGRRWAYGLFLVLALAWLPARAGFHLVAPVCEGIPSFALAMFSFTNLAHIVLFAVFFLMTVIQLPGPPQGAARLGWAAVVTVAMGAAVELLEGVAQTGHCRLRDLLPDAAGAALGAAAWLVWRKLFR
jgi:hypothetical protein